MREYEKAAAAYEQSLSVNAKSLIGKFSLIFVYRDKLNKIEKARELFNSIDKQEVNRSENLMCRYFLNKASFELYDHNKGLAKESVFSAFEVLEKENRLATMANELWWVKFGSVVMNSGSGAWLLDVLVIAPNTGTLRLRESRSGFRLYPFALSCLTLSRFQPFTLFPNRIYFNKSQAGGSVFRRCFTKKSNRLCSP